jgi:hypothetical protein
LRRGRLALEEHLAVSVDHETFLPGGKHDVIGADDRLFLAAEVQRRVRRRELSYAAGWVDLEVNAHAVEPVELAGAVLAVRHRFWGSI